MKKKLILASTSPRRRRMLKEFKIPFTLIAPHADEGKIQRGIKSKDPVVIAQVIAYEKAKSVLKKFKSGIVLGADTIVVLGNEIIGKPRSQKDAERILGKLSGSTHRVITAIAFIDAGTQKTLVTYDISYVTFDRIGISKIRSYITENHVLDKAGAYAIQDGADPFIRRIKGSYYNVVGLPIEKVRRILRLWDKL
jgi:septum formation protein